jgi:hypothetical protein
MTTSILPLQWPAQYEDAGLLSDLPLLGSNAVLWHKFRRLAAARDFSAVLLWGDNAITLRAYTIVSAIAISEFAWGPVVFIPDDLCRVVFWNPRWGQEDMDSILMLSRAFKLSDDVVESWTRHWTTITLGNLVRDISHHGI